MTTDHFSRLRALLSEEYGYRQLEALFELFDQWPDGQDKGIAQEYAREHMEAWGLSGDEIPICLLELTKSSWGSYPADALLTDLDDSIVVATSDEIQRIDSTGAVLWQQTLEAPLAAIGSAGGLIHGVDQRGKHLQWSLATGALQAEAKRVPAKPVHGFLKPDCQQIVVGYPGLEGPQMALWDLRKGEEIGKCPSHGVWNMEEAFTDDVAFAPDGSAVAILNEIQGSLTSYGNHWQWEYHHAIRSWSTTSCSDLNADIFNKTREDEYGFGKYVYTPGACAFSPDGRWILNYKEEDLTLHPTQEGQEPPSWSGSYSETSSSVCIGEMKHAALNSGLVLAAVAHGTLGLIQLHHWLKQAIAENSAPYPPRIELPQQDDAEVTRMQWSLHTRRLWVWSKADTPGKELLHCWDMSTTTGV